MARPEDASKRLAGITVVVLNICPQRRLINSRDSMLWKGGVEEYFEGKPFIFILIHHTRTRTRRAYRKVRDKVRERNVRERYVKGT